MEKFTENSILETAIINPDKSTISISVETNRSNIPR